MINLYYWLKKKKLENVTKIKKNYKNKLIMKHKYNKIDVIVNKIKDLNNVIFNLYIGS